MSTYQSSHTGPQIDAGIELANSHPARTDNPHGVTLPQVGGSNKNLLDNAWFAAPYLVNQRGQASYTSDGYSIDRWSGYSHDVAVNSGGVTIVPTAYSNTLIQFVENWDQMVGKTVTLSFDVSDITGSVSIAAYNNVIGSISTTGITSVTFIIPSVLTGNNFVGLAGNTGTSITLIAAKLELGSVSTLANDTPPSPAEQVLNRQVCMRYYYKCTANYATGYTYAGVARFSIPLPVPMRIANPAITISGYLICNGVSEAMGSVLASEGADTAVLTLAMSSSLTSTFPLCAQPTAMTASADL